MPFGYMPHETAWKDIILRVFGWPSVIRRLQAPVLMRMLSLDKRDVVLDAGCGAGAFTYETARKCRLSIGIDWSLDANLSLAMSKQPRVTFISGDAQALPFSPKKFDKILLSSVLQMAKDDTALLKECHRVLKNECVLVLSVPVGYIHLKRLNLLKPQLRDKFGSRGKGYYDYDEIVELLEEEGFKVEEVEYSPKRWGSLVFELGLFLWYRFGFPFFSAYVFPLFYPIAYFDRFADSKQKGNELIIKAIKVSK